MRSPNTRTLLFFVLATVPLLRTCYVVATTGANCISNDDIIFLSLTENMRAGGYEWRHFWEDTFINGHCSAAAQAFFLVLGPLVAWNQYVLCGLGIALCVVRTHVTSKFLSISNSKLYWPAVAIVSCLFFSFSQICLFTTGIFSVMWQSCLLFITLPLYLLWRYPDRISATVASSIFGILACWNLAVGLPGWIVYFLIVAARGGRKILRSAIVGAGMLIAGAPYASFIFAGAARSRKFSEQFVHWFDSTFFVNAVGRQFANQIGHKFELLPVSDAAGIIGLVAFGILIGVAFASARLRRLLAPSMTLCICSLVVLLVIGVVRSGIAPWYALIAAMFWAGLGTACVVLAADADPNADRIQRAGSIAFPSMMLGAMAVWTLLSNRTYLDKQYYLENRTAVAASVLRNYDVAGDNFASYVFKLPGLSSFVTAKMLERNRWSVFSRRQTWEMQGDALFPLANGYKKGVDVSGGFWIKGNSRTAPDDFRSPKHLNLCLMPSGGKAIWRIEVPHNARRVRMSTAVAAERQATADGEKSPCRIRLEDVARGQNTLLAEATAGKDWQPISVDVSNRRGTKFDITFENLSDRNAIVFQYPVLQLDVR